MAAVKLFYGFLLVYVISLSRKTYAQQNCGKGIGSCSDPSYPCCSKSGYCGNTAAHCLFGVQEEFSVGDRFAKLPNCTDPIDLDFTSGIPRGAQDVSNFTLNETDPSKQFLSGIPFFFSNGPLTSYNQSLALPLKPAEDGSGNGEAPKIYIPCRILYGEVTIEIAAVVEKGFVTAATLGGYTNDEIDWEWVSKDPSTVQANRFSKYKIIYNQNDNLHVGNIRNFNTYTIKWSPESITWNVLNTGVEFILPRKKTYNDSIQEYLFPDTPLNLEMTVWDATGKEPDTMKWAGAPHDPNWHTRQPTAYVRRIQISPGVYPRKDGTTSKGLETGKVSGG